MRTENGEYAEFFRKARIQKGITQTELAREIGVSANQLISNVERGICRYPVARLNKLIRLLGLDREETIRLILRREEKRIRKVIR